MRCGTFPLPGSERRECRRESTRGQAAQRLPVVDERVGHLVAEGVNVVDAVDRGIPQDPSRRVCFGLQAIPTRRVGTRSAIPLISIGPDEAKLEL
jgi:hypothetical protein